MKYKKIDKLKELEFRITYLNIRDKEEKLKCIQKMNIYLITNINEKMFPPVARETYFWIRISCSLKNERPSSENKLLAGTTSYKEYLLNVWLIIKILKDKAIDTFSLTKNTEAENLIGTSSLDDENKLEVQIKYLILYFHLDSSDIKDDDYVNKIKLIKKIKKKIQV